MNKYYIIFLALLIASCNKYKPKYEFLPYESDNQDIHKEIIWSSEYCFARKEIYHPFATEVMPWISFNIIVGGDTTSYICDGCYDTKVTNDTLFIYDYKI